MNNKNKNHERGLFELYAEDPERADAVILGRKPNHDGAASSKP